MRGRRRNREPVAVGTVVGRVLGELGMEAAAAAYRIGQHWEDIVGTEAARHSRPVGVRGPVLEAEVDTSVWCQEIQLRRSEILDALRQLLGEDSPSDLRLRVGYNRPR